MRTTILLASMVLSLNIPSLFAGNDVESPLTVSKPAIEFNYKLLAPVTPEEATFDDDFTSGNNTLSIVSLAPGTPETASFEDIAPTIPGMNDLLRNMAPMTPLEAEFTDQFQISIKMDRLSPTAPKEASFDEK